VAQFFKCVRLKILLLRSLASYSPWANIAPGVFYYEDKLENSSRVVVVLTFLDLLFSRMCLVRWIKILSTFVYIFK
jgi:hypothetical protein